MTLFLISFGVGVVVGLVGYKVVPILWDKLTGKVTDAANKL